MITAASGGAATRAMPGGMFIPGALVVGEDARERGALARRVTLSLFAGGGKAGLVYVGPEEEAKQLREALPAGRARVSGAVAMADTTERGGAVVQGFDAGIVESRYGAVCVARAGFFLIATRRRLRPFVIALDGFAGAVGERARGKFREGLRQAITAPAVAPVLCFESFAEMRGCLDAECLDLLMKFERVYILRSDFDAGDLDLFWSESQRPGGGRDLRPGKVLAVRQSYGGGVSHLSQELTTLDRVELPSAA